jgi:UDP-glucose 4-epimerase
MNDAILVTGGAGFIGSHLVERLLRDGERVVVLDDLSTGSAENLAAVAGHPKLELVVGSVLDMNLVDGLTVRARTVVHLAAAVGVRLVVDRWFDSLNLNQFSCHAVLEAARRHGTAVLLASTSEVYGKNVSDRIPETADLIIGQPRVARWSYALAKALAEASANAYFAEFGLPVTVVRLFNTVGPRQSPEYGMVIPRLVRQALAGEPLTVYGDGRQTRCFCHVSDAVDAIVGLLGEPRAVGETFNIGSSEETSIDKLARLVIQRTGSASKIMHIPYEQAFRRGFEEMPGRVPDTSKLSACLGWRPRAPLAKILAEVIKESVRARAG